MTLAGRQICRKKCHKVKTKTTFFGNEEISAKEKIISYKPLYGPLMPYIVKGVLAISFATWRLRIFGADILDEVVTQGGVLALFHEDIFCMVSSHSHRGWFAIADHSRCGELAARLLHLLGYSCIRGSSSRGGALALSESCAQIREGSSVVVTVDGPQGPRLIPKAGVAVIAARTQQPIIFACASVRGAVRTFTWDRLIIPLPGAKIYIQYGRMEPPVSDKADVIASALVELEARMRKLKEDLEKRVLAR